MMLYLQSCNTPLKQLFQTIPVYAAERCTSNLVSVVFSFLMEETSNDSLITLPQNCKYYAEYKTYDS